MIIKSISENYLVKHKLKKIINKIFFEHIPPSIYIINILIYD